MKLELLTISITEENKDRGGRGRVLLCNPNVKRNLEIVEIFSSVYDHFHFFLMIAKSERTDVITVLPSNCRCFFKPRFTLVPIIIVISVFVHKFLMELANSVEHGNYLFLRWQDG